MIRHVACLTFVDHATPAQRQAVLDALGRLRAQIPAIRAYAFGVDAGIDGSANASLAITADFDDAAGYETYRDHPEHRAVLVEVIRPILTSRVAVQYDIA